MSAGRVALVAALALSLLGNAVALGGALKLQRVKTALLGEAAAAQSVVFPAEIRRDLRRALEARRDRIDPALAAAVAARAEVVARGAAEPFDRAATEEAMRGFRRALDALLDLTQETVLDALGARASGAPLN
ncbi:hypothetical protein BV509_16560 [Rhodovulum sulfidophilum]|uniref:Heavy-metal resistance protein n=1 Tax=Rhodovulum visakhapatnamense TaxID=364297 RepID=A0ABS1RCD2_9RHOB|nr:hypothetical protein [Rhodovulum visakhapatnamense]MBL3569329.1 hypothetical protein [Rhodovulum visakhapatnamense]MBL3577299.1 hypothetical protein [Rhodovulum visakhapatnamense]OLS45806.1 hypothetical protein BV509_16560 [Rhodovulum sulfidophilum]